MKNTLKLNCIYAIIFVIASLLISSCANDTIPEDEFIKQDDYIIKKTYHEDGSLHIKKELILFNGDTLLHGSYYEYYQDGNVKKKGQFLNDQKFGEWILYFENSLEENNVQKRLYYIMDRLALHQLEYYLNQKIAYYGFAYPEYGDHIIYRRIYNDKGNLELEEGLKKPIVGVYTSNDYGLDSLKVGDTLTLSFWHIDPPNVETMLYVKCEGYFDEWKKIPSTNDYYIPPDFSFTLEKKGNFLFQTKFIMIENDQKLKFFRELDFNVN